MTTMTHQEIVNRHDLITENVNSFFGSLSQEQFTANINDGWSPAEHVAHLIMGYKLVAKALALPKTALALRFGKRNKNRQDDSYETIVSKYKTALNAGFKSPKEFVPKQDKMVLDNSQAIQKMQESSARFKNSLVKWDDSNLDTYLLPHPALERKITIRELMYFELFHSLHHRNNVAKDLGLEESWPV